MGRARIAVFGLGVVVLCAGARADDAYFRVPIRGVHLTEGTLPENGEPARWDMGQLLRPYVVLDGVGEAFVATPGALEEGQANVWGPRWAGSTSVFVARAPEGRPVTGWMFVPSADWTALVPLKFSVEPGAATDGAKRDFFRAKAAHYNDLRRTGGAGAAWFRRQAAEAGRVLVAEFGEQDRTDRQELADPELEDTYGLFTGGRAVSENLQLHRQLPGAAGREADPGPEKLVPLGSVEGITVQPMDWTKLLGDSKPTLDTLAGAIPADQHAVFFPSFGALAACLDETKKNGLPLFRTVGPRSEDGQIIGRYERQLGLSVDGLGAVLGAKLVKSVAVTGSDPYFPTGTDVAVVFEAADPGSLRDLLLARIMLFSGTAPGVVGADGEVEGVRFRSVISPDRVVSSYVAVVGRNVVVTNSKEQLRVLAVVAAGKATALSKVPEYSFFRARYAVGATGETAFVLLSDAAIRRWCGPEWRVGASRRLRAGAILADVTAAHMDEIVAGVKSAHAVGSDVPMRTIGELTIGPEGVRSSVYGGVTFLTPICELEIQEITESESASYKRWRDTYQRNWSWAFDPIALSLGVAPERVSADMTVMPLILGSEYRTYLNFAMGASIAPDAGDPHGALAHAVVAVNTKSQAVQQASNFALMMAPQVKVEPLGWLGHSVALYADSDPFWGEMLLAKDPDKFFEERAYQMPVALHAEVESAMKLTAFLAALRAYIDQSAPGMTAWETRTYKDQPYVTVGMSETAKAQARGQTGLDKLQIHYVATPQALIITPNEDVLKRAIDRAVAKAPGKADAPAADRPWLGSSLCFQFTREGLELVQGPGRDSYRRALQGRAWANIPILNEWKRRYPGKDPVKVHEEEWGVRPVCPGGGRYVWNELFKTMESTVFGHPGEAKAPESGLAMLGGILAGNFGLTFEESGLRARAVVEREAAPK